MDSIIPNKSITLQLLEDLLFALKKVLPNIHSPLGVSNMILVLLADVRFLFHRIRDLENAWELHLPFGEGDDRDVNWDVWKKDFSPERIRPFLENLGERHEQMMEGDRFPYSEDGMMVQSRNMQYVADQSTLELFLKETNVSRRSLTRLTVGLKFFRPELMHALLVELNQFWEIIDLTEHIISVPNDDKIKDFYEERKRIYEETCENKIPFNPSDINSRNKKFYLISFYERMLKSKFIGVSVPVETSAPNYLEKAKNVWDGLLDETGCPDIVEIGRYIYQNRRKLTQPDLEGYFEYMELYDFLQEQDVKFVVPAVQVVKKKKVTNHIVPDHKVFHRKCGTGRGKDINLQSLRKVIEKGCLPEIIQSYHWFCLWRILVYKEIVKKEAPQTCFIQKMQEWYPEHDPHCSKDSLHTYASSYFTYHIDYNTWDAEAYRKDLKGKKGKPKENPNICEELKSICERMDLYLADFYEHPNVEL